MTEGHTIHQAVLGKSRSRPDAVFLRSVDGRDPLTFQQLGLLVAGVLRQLGDLGVTRGDRVVTALPNGPESASLFLAVASVSACAPLNPGYSGEQFAFYVDDLQPGAIILPSGVDSPLREVASTRAIPIIDIRATGTAGTFETNSVESSGTFGVEVDLDFADEPEPSDVALLLHTSGTTGSPKLVEIPHSNLIVSAQNIATRLALTPDDRALNIMPLFHIHGLVGVLLSSLVAGSEVVCTPGLDATSVGDQLINTRATWYSGVPTMHSAILSALRDQWNPDAGRLRFVRSSSASLPILIFEQLESMFRVPVIEAYGMTEASHQMATNPLPPGVRKPGSVGLPAGPEVAIMGDDGGRAGVGETGEVIIRGQSVIESYAGGRSPESFVDGWFRTGDLGHFDDDGYLVLSGRIKEMINRGGEKVAPAFVENVLLSHQAVREAAVFGVSHPTLGEDVFAAIVPQPGSNVSRGEIRRFALEKLADTDVPGRVLLVDAIPKGPTGKVQRSLLHIQLADTLRTAYSRPEGRIANMLVRIWKEVLPNAEPGANDNFFAIGGDSLSAARVVARVSQIFDIEFDIRSLFVDPELAGMADRIESGLRSKVDREHATQQD